MLVVRPGRTREEQGDDDMGTDDTGTTTAPTLQREVCDKCGSRMELESSAYGFERWKCPKCQQVVGIDRDPEVGHRFQIERGQPWNYSPDAFKN
jgi:phage FluMu protein Com